MIRRPAYAAWVIGILTMIAATSCAKRDPSLAGSDGTLPDQEVVQTNGWSKLKMITHGSDIEINFIGHYHNSRNAAPCWTESFGVLKLDDWNAIAAAMNDAIKGGLVHDDVCIPAPDASGDYAFDGSANVVLPNDTDPNSKGVFAFELRGRELCTRLSDAQATSRLVTLLNRVMKQVFTESCSF